MSEFIFTIYILVPSLYWGETAEEAFKYHVQNLGVYGLMEILASWDAE